MNHDLIRRCFRHDLRELLGFDPFEMCVDLDFLFEESSGFEDLTHDVVKQPFKQMHVNLMKVLGEYLEYNEERFPVPLDQYVWIYENSENIRKILAENMETKSPFNDPLSYTLWHRIHVRFEVMLENLVLTGKTHNFDEEMLPEDWSYVEDNGEDER